jgi:hypothetical protein
LESDFNLLVLSCNEVVSAQVPNSLREIAKSIADKEDFRRLSPEEATRQLTIRNLHFSQKLQLIIEELTGKGLIAELFFY